METDNFIVALEIGTTKVCAAAANYNDEGKVLLRAFSQVRIMPEDEVLINGHLDNIDKTKELVNEVLENISMELGIDLKDININYSNSQIETHKHSGTYTRKNEGKQVSQDDIDRLIEDSRKVFNNKRDNVILHHLPTDFYVNDAIAVEKVVGKVGVQIKGDFMVITSPSQSFENFYETISEVKAKVEGNEAVPNLKMDHVLLSTIADSFSLIKTEIDDKRNGVAIVNIGADLTELAVFFKNSMRFFKAITIAGNAITQDLKETFGISFDEAEKLKKICSVLPFDLVPDNEVVIVERPASLSPVEILLKNAVMVAEWRLKEIAGLVKVELARAGFDTQLLNGIIITGGTSNYGTVSTVFREVTKVKSIRKAEYVKSIDFGEFEQLNKPQYSTLLGLLLAHNNNFDNRVSNSILRHQKIEFVKQEISKPIPVKPPKAPKQSIFKSIFNLSDDKELNDHYTN